MCGLVGFSGNFDPSLIPSSLAAIAHRGPDDQGIYVDENHRVALGHRRLSIIDLSSAGHQPMVSQDGQVVVAFNGEIYNYLGLKSQLERQGAQFRSHSDTEVVLELFREHGIGMLSRLNGIFALAIFDTRSGDLWLARDRFGVKPLYLGLLKEGICFASEVKALITFLHANSLTLNPEALHRFLTFLWCPGNGTMLREIHKLGPGELICIRDGKKVEQQQWCDLPQGRVTVQPMSSDDAVTAVRDALREAVRRQLVADVPVGSFLSGGLDSSAIVAFAREQVPDIRCFTIETAGDEDSGVIADLPYARKIAAYLGVHLDVVSIESADIAREIESMVWQLDEPLADPAALNVLYISRLAQRSGIKVLLSGAGGDDLFTGYRRHLALRYERVWNWLPASARRRIATIADRFDQRNVFGRRLARFATTFAADGDAGLVSYFAWARRKDLIPLYSHRLREQIRKIEAQQPMLDYLKGMSPEASQLDRMLALEQRFFLADHNLIYTDKMSMAIGVEVRVPFLDNDLVALAARVPDRYKQNGRIGKWVLKKAMEPYLPQSAIYRPKTGFGAPLRRWVLDDLSDMISEYLSENNLRARAMFDPYSVTRLINANRSGCIDASYTILSVLCIEIWCRRFIDETGLTVDMARTIP